MAARWWVALSCIPLAMPCAAQEAGKDQIIVEASPPLDRSALTERIRDGYRSSVMHEPVMRYLDPVCVQVNGLGPNGNAQVLEHMRKAISSLSINLAPSGCLANAIVVISTEPVAQLERIHAENPDLLPQKQLRKKSREFSAGAHAVVWHNRHIRGANGEDLPLNGTIAGFIRHFSINAVINNNGRASFTRAGYAVTANAGVAAYDARKLVGVELKQLAHHAVMRLLAPGFALEIAPGSPESILSGIERGIGPPALTRFDRSVLTGLYNLKPDALGVTLARSAGRAYESEE